MTTERAEMTAQEKMEMIGQHIENNDLEAIQRMVGEFGPAVLGPVPDTLDTALNLAAASNKMTIVRYIVEKKPSLVNIEAYERGQNSPLYEATNNGYNDIAYFLLQNGAIPYNQEGSPEKDGDTTLHELGNLSDYRVVRNLVAASAGYLDIVNVTDATPLIALCQHPFVDGRHPEIINILCRAGANVNAQDSEGKTALHYAVESMTAQGHNIPTAVNALLANGANPMLKDNLGKTAVDLARELGITTILGHLQLDITSSEVVSRGGGGGGGGSGEGPGMSHTEREVERRAGNSGQER